MAIKLTDEQNRSFRAALAIVFGQEWAMLSPSDKTLIVRDCTDDGKGIDLAEYRSNIGIGNLQSYAEVMRVRYRKGGK